MPKLDIPECKQRQDLVLALESGKITNEEYINENDRLVKIIREKTKNYLDNVVIEKHKKIKEDIKTGVKCKTNIYKDVRELFKEAREVFQTIQQFKQEVYHEFYDKSPK